MSDEAVAGRPALARQVGDVVVRRIRADEWQALRDLRLRALADAPDAFGATLEETAARPDEAWQARIADEQSIMVVAERAGRLVGMASGGDAPMDDPSAALYSMWVDPAVRGRGVAGAIVETVVDWATAAGYRRIGLGVTTSNARAIAFYERLGFADIGLRMPLRPGSELEIQIMARQLT
jgi:ribosomal protein S18 acetylase RimI-like enzyme